MRKLNHEQETLQLFAELWQKYPDLRFFQLVELIKVYAERNSDTDPFYMEGPAIISILNKMLGNVSS